MNVTKSTITAFIVSIALSAPAMSASLYFDFGDSAQLTAGNYNNVIVNPPTTLSILNAIDSTGAGTGIGMTAAGFYNGSNQSGTVAPSGAAAIFDPQATRDNAFGHAAAFGGNPLTPSATLDFTGLNPLLSYDFTFFASRLPATDNRETEYAVTGSNAGTAYLDAANNVSNVAIVSGITPTGAGTIQVVVDPGPNNSSTSLFYYLGALELTGVPEPASTTLVMFGIAFLGLSRHSFSTLRRS